MKIIEKYTGLKTYMFPNGEIASPDRMEEAFPAVKMFAHVIETDDSGEVCYAVQNLNALRSFYNIDKSFTEEEAIEAIQELINQEEPQEEPVPSPEERIAAALEFLNLNSMDDVEE